jgi:lipoprotein NlpI
MTRLLLISVLCLPVLAQDVRTTFDRAVADFKAGRIAESVRGFDQVVKLRPEVQPQLWQRGIALYYAGRYADCRKQFESHRTVNPDDVENSVWHFLCVTRETSLAKATQSLLPVGPDDRVPMREIYSMFAGKLSPDAVMKAVGSDPSALFYAHLYIGLWYEALGKKEDSLQRIRLAAKPDYAEFGGYMHDVARVHLALRTREAGAPPAAASQAALRLRIPAEAPTATAAGSPQYW